MKAVLLPPSSSRRPLPKRPVCRFVILYEDYLAVERAEAFCEKMTHKLHMETICRKEAWSFQVLQQFPDIARMTAKGAAEHADFIILSLDGFAELPAHVKAWLKTWARGGGVRLGDQKHALITLFNELSLREGACASTKAYLDRFTNRLRN